MLPKPNEDVNALTPQGRRALCPFPPLHPLCSRYSVVLMKFTRLRRLQWIRVEV